MYAILKGLIEFRSDLNNLMALFIQAFLPFLLGFLYHFLYIISIQSIENITKPLLVNVDPILLIWKVPEENWVTLGMLQEILL